MIRRLLLLASVLAPAACASSAPSAPPLLLMGEVHDHPAQPAHQVEALHALLRQGVRPALLLEPFDRERQLDIDRARVAGGDADALIRAGSGGDPTASRWDWRRYRPLIDIALANGLPVIAANVSRADTRKVIADGLAAHGFDERVPPEVLAAQAATIEASHCGQVDAALARRMALAQVARDQFMARQLDAQSARGALLIAGHGHVRRDIGVPRWLARRDGVTVVGLVEAGTDTSAFDHAEVWPPAPRPDPCARSG